MGEMYVRINGEMVYLWGRSITKAKCWKTTFLSESGKRTYINSTRRITPGDELK
jgi:hypothetical protein